MIATHLYQTSVRLWALLHQRGGYVAGRGWTPILHPRGIPELVGHRKPLFLFRVTLAVHWCVR